MRQSVSLFIAATFLAVASFMSGSVALPTGKAGLDNTLDVTLGTASSTVKSLVGGVVKPQSIGSKTEGQKGGHVAGSNIDKKRDDTLLRGMSLGVNGVVVGVKSTVEGVINPQTRGSRKDTEDAAAEAGKNVGGAIGNALLYGWNSSAGVLHHYATLWLPKLTGWVIDIGRPKKFLVSVVPLGVLRRSWQSPPPRRPWPHPPLVHIRSYLPYLRAFWKALWSLDLAGKDLQRWWRLLHHSIACDSYRHLLNRTVAPTCPFCSGYEDRYHLVVGCPFKTYLWIELIQHFNFSATFPNIEAIWMGLTFDPNCLPLLDDHLLFLGQVFSTI
ncbi:hypothetical protein BD408DRAFT_443450 [Parasitella parasitica]|nr:hypothetical protein BD408DRAFT_443450 [Parasitella parasitica]